MTSHRNQTPSHIAISRVLFPLGLGTALSLMGDATLYTVLPTHTEDAGVTLAGVGILLGVNRAVRLLTNGLAGLAYDRMPRRRIFLPALFLGALSTAIYAATRGFWPLLVGRLLWGTAWSGIWVGGATMIMDVAAPQERGRWTGLYQIWFFVGSALGSLSGGVLTDLVGYDATMWIGSALTALGGLVALFMLPETSKLRAPTEATLAPEAQATADEAPGSRDGALSPKANPPLWLAVSLQGLNRFIVSGVVSGTIGLVIQDWMADAGIAMGVATVTGLILAGRTVLSMVSAPLSGTLSDRLPSRWTVVAGGLVIGALGIGLLAWGSSAGILIGISTVAVAYGNLQSLSTTLTGDSVKSSQRGRAIGLLHTIGDLGSAIGPSIAYALLPLLGLRTLYLLCAGLFAVSLGLVVRFEGRQVARG